jgi:hypothetical protein
MAVSRYLISNHPGKNDGRHEENNRGYAISLHVWRGCYFKYGKLRNSVERKAWHYGPGCVIEETPNFLSVGEFAFVLRAGLDFVHLAYETKWNITVRKELFLAYAGFGLRYNGVQLYIDQHWLRDGIELYSAGVSIRW